MKTLKRAWWFRAGLWWLHLSDVSPRFFMGKYRYDEGDCICEQLWAIREGLA